MTWVRLIGGVKDGQVAKVDPDQTHHIEQKSLPIMTGRVTSLGSMSAEIKRTLYTRRSVSTPGGDIAFFADEALSDYAALYSALGP